MDKEIKDLISAAKGAQDCLQQIEVRLRGMAELRSDANRQWNRIQRAIDNLIGEHKDG